MAWYDQFYFSTSNSKIQGWLGWNLSQNVSANTSTITCSLQFCRQADAYTTSGVYGGTISVSYSVDGVAKSQSANISKTIALSGGAWVVAGTASFTIPHNANGTQSITVKTSGSIPSTTLSTASGSKTSTLTTIPRYATISTYQLDSRTCDSLTVKWTANVTCSAIKYNIDDGSWTEKSVSASSGTFTFTGLTPNTSYKVGLYVKRKNSGLYTTSAKYANFTTYNIPTITSEVNFNIGDSLTLSVSNPANNSYTIGLYVNDALVRTSSATTATSYTWLFTTADLTALYAACPNGKTVSVSFKTSVTINSTTYTSTKSGTATVVESSNIPSTPAITLASDNSAVNTALGVTTKGVQGIGSFTVTIKTDSTAKNSATIKNYTCKVIKGGTVYKTTISTTKSLGFASLSESGDYTVQVYATDSRGFNSEVTSTTLSIIAYKAPTITVEIERVNSYEQEILLDLRGVISKLLVGSTMKNSLKALKYCYAETGSSYGGYISLTPATDTSGTDIVTTVSYSDSSAPFLTLPSKKSYNIQFYIEDALQSVTYTTFIKQGIPSVAVLENGQVAINCTPDINNQDEKLLVNGNSKILGELTLLNDSFPDGINIGEIIKEILDTTFNREHPIGSIFMSVLPDNPSTYLGKGTWVAWGSGRVPIGVDTSQSEFNSVGKTGGNKTVDLSHSHTVNEHKHISTCGFDESTWYVAQPNGTGVSACGNTTTENTGYAVKYTSYTKTSPVRLGYTGTSSPGTNSQLSNSQSILQPYITCYMWKRTA